MANMTIGPMKMFHYPHSLTSTVKKPTPEASNTTLDLFYEKVKNLQPDAQTYAETLDPAGKKQWLTKYLSTNDSEKVTKVLNAVLKDPKVLKDSIIKDLQSFFEALNKSQSNPEAAKVLEEVLSLHCIKSLLKEEGSSYKEHEKYQKILFDQIKKEAETNTENLNKITLFRRASYITAATIQRDHTRETRLALTGSKSCSDLSFLDYAENKGVTIKDDAQVSVNKNANLPDIDLEEQVEDEYLCKAMEELAQSNYFLKINDNNVSVLNSIRLNLNPPTESDRKILESLNEKHNKCQENQYEQAQRTHLDMALNYKPEILLESDRYAIKNAKVLAFPIQMGAITSGHYMLGILDKATQTLHVIDSLQTENNKDRKNYYETTISQEFPKVLDAFNEYCSENPIQIKKVSYKMGARQCSDNGCGPATLINLHRYLSQGIDDLIHQSEIRVSKEEELVARALIGLQKNRPQTSTT